MSDLGIGVTLGGIDFQVRMSQVMIASGIILLLLVVGRVLYDHAHDTGYMMGYNDAISGQPINEDAEKSLFEWGTR